MKMATWLLSAEGDSCDSACATVQLTCDLTSLLSALSESTIVSAARAAGVECGSDVGATEGWSYASNPGVCTNEGCCGTEGACQGVCTFGAHPDVSCSSSGGHYSRICACEKPSQEAAVETSFAAVSSGTCEEAGFLTITDNELCGSAAASLRYGITWPSTAATQGACCYNDVVDGCSVRAENQLFFGSIGTNTNGQTCQTGQPCLCAMPSSGDIVEENAPTAGGHGGSCTCPDGSVYQVGDNYDYCGSLACVGGTSGTCNSLDGVWSSRKVTCNSENIVEPSPPPPLLPPPSMLEVTPASPSCPVPASDPSTWQVMNGLYDGGSDFAGYFIVTINGVQPSGTLAIFSDDVEGPCCRGLAQSGQATPDVPAFGASAGKTVWMPSVKERCSLARVPIDATMRYEFTLDGESTSFLLERTDGGDDKWPQSPTMQAPIELGLSCP